MLASIISSNRRCSKMLAFSNNNYGLDFGAKQSVELFCAYFISVQLAVCVVNIFYTCLGISELGQPIKTCYFVFIFFLIGIIYDQLESFFKRVCLICRFLWLKFQRLYKFAEIHFFQFAEGFVVYHHHILHSNLLRGYSHVFV